MSAALLLLAAAVTPDLAFEAYGKCAQAAAAAYKGPTDTIEAVVGRIQGDCASDRTALLDVAPDKPQAAEWIRMTTTLAVSEHVPNLATAGEQPKDQAAAKPVAAVSRYPKFDSYRLCGETHAAKVLAEMRYAAVDAIAKEASAECERLLKPAADEFVAEMRQPSLRQQVMMDFRRRATAELTQKISAQRAGKK